MSDLDRWVADLGRGVAALVPEARKIVEVAGAKMKRTMAEEFTGHRGMPHIPRAVGYDVRGLSVEVGVDKDGPQGGLGNIAAFGTAVQPAILDHTRALREEIPHVERLVAGLGERSLS